ncbi:putative porin [Flavobacterium oreochromis]|uniref:putative porin n=1 Tax=Flavobacterium oreochromis TaxID=2906078 RepID=UPI001F43A449|nr:putative porin [Flavobacterium oreochromis]
MSQSKDSIKSLRQAPKENPKAPHNWYKIYNLKKDTTFVDTSLTIKSDYKFNLLRKDNFGLLPFANDGSVYTILDYSYNYIKALPNIGFNAKQFNYLNSEDILYYNVPTPLTELYFKTVLEQGQNIDAFITLNTSKKLNFSLAYKGLRSLGKYLNSLTSTGNFRFTSSYQTKNERYGFNLHFTSQDFTNQENGGILNITDFTSGDPQFSQRSRLDVKLRDAKSFFEGKRYFLDQYFRLNRNQKLNNVLLEHQFKYEIFNFSFEKLTRTDYFGLGYENSNYSDLTKSSTFYNKIGTTFFNTSIGKFNIFIEDSRFRYGYNRLVIENQQIKVPARNDFSVQNIGGKYFYLKGKFRGEALFSKAISKNTNSTIDIFAKYTVDNKNSFSAQYTNLSKLPDLTSSLYQSDFVAYNWKNYFNNEKINSFRLNAQTQWGTLESQFTVLHDHIYFSNDDLTQKTLLTSPKQCKGPINYFSAKLQKELKLGKWALDNSIVYQQVIQAESILNVPKILTRNTLYFSDHYFKKALFLQTGITLQYFTNYYANGYNPLIGNFYTQTDTTIGNHPIVDFFVNARVRQTRIFLKAEHLNAAFINNDFFAAPSQPYKDFLIRFGLVWNFFQ